MLPNIIINVNIMTKNNIQIILLSHFHFEVSCKYKAKVSPTQLGILKEIFNKYHSV